MSLGRIAATAIRRFTFTRYLLASLCALCCDLALFLALVRAGARPSLSAFAGYCAGLVLHWLISVRFVFTSAQSRSHAQRLGFVASAIIGLGVTMGLVSGLTAIGFAPAIAKAAAVPVSFLSVYAIRKYGVFAPA